MGKLIDLNDKNPTVSNLKNVIEELIRYVVLLKEEHSKIGDDKQDIMKNLDRTTSICEKLQMENKELKLKLKELKEQDKRQSLKRRIEEMETENKEFESWKKRVKQAEEIVLSKAAQQSPETNYLARRLINESPTSNSVIQKVRSRLMKSDVEIPKIVELDNDEQEDENEIDENMIDLTNTTAIEEEPKIESKPSTMRVFSNEQFQTTQSAIDILHAIIQETNFDKEKEEDEQQQQQLLKKKRIKFFK